MGVFLGTAHFRLHADDRHVEVQQLVVDVDVTDAAHKVLLRDLACGRGPGQATQLQRSRQVQQAVTVHDGVVTSRCEEINGVKRQRKRKSGRVASTRIENSSSRIAFMLRPSLQVYEKRIHVIICTAGLGTGVRKKGIYHNVYSRFE